MTNAQTQVATAQAGQAKYRDEEEFTTHIGADRRVHRGSNFGGAAQIGGGTRGAARGGYRPTKKKPKVQEINPWAIPLPEQERPAVDLSRYLTAAEEQLPPVPTRDHGDQCAEFKPKKPEPSYDETRKRSGLDASTHIEEGDLFKFDDEVVPLLEVLVSKTLEQWELEVEEEAEMAQMAAYKTSWTAANIAEKEFEDSVVEDERKRHAYRLALKAERKALGIDAVKKKVLCQYASRTYLKDLWPNAFEALQDTHSLFVDAAEKEVKLSFMPWVTAAAGEQVQKYERNAAVVGSMLRQEVSWRTAGNVAARDEMNARFEAKAMEAKAAAVLKAQEEEAAAAAAAAAADGGDGGDGAADGAGGDGADGA